VAAAVVRGTHPRTDWPAFIVLSLILFTFVFSYWDRRDRIKTNAAEIMCLRATISLEMDTRIRLAHELRPETADRVEDVYRHLQRVLLTPRDCPRLANLPLP
jgi:hypothetical protein